MEPRVAETKDLTESCVCPYLDTVNNPADDLTSGKALNANTETPEELRKAAFGGVTISTPKATGTEFKTWKELIDATVRELQPLSSAPSADEYQQAEITALRKAYEQQSPEDHALLSARKPVLARSQLVTVVPEMDQAIGLIRVGSRLKRLEGQAEVSPHPIVLDSSHRVT